MKTTLILLTLFFSFWAFAHTTEEILGVSYDGAGMTFHVQSGGCTNKSDFNFIVSLTSPPQLTLVRNRQDLCEAMLPYGQIIKFTYSEMGLKSGDEFVITNKLKSPMRVP